MAATENAISAQSGARLPMKTVTPIAAITPAVRATARSSVADAVGWVMLNATTSAYNATGSRRPSTKATTALPNAVYVPEPGFLGVSFALSCS